MVDFHVPLFTNTKERTSKENYYSVINDGVCCAGVGKKRNKKHRKKLAICMK